jgi:hypothetical protein
LLPTLDFSPDPLGGGRSGVVAAPMDPRQVLEEHIPSFPGYETEEKRRLSDELVRSYLGEALATITLRIPNLPQALADRIEGLLIRTSFANQHVFRLYEEGVCDRDDFTQLAQADAAVVELAERAKELDAATLPAYLDDATAALDHRDSIMSSFQPPPPPATSPRILPSQKS